MKKSIKYNKMKFQKLFEQKEKELIQLEKN